MESLSAARESRHAHRFRFDSEGLALAATRCPGTSDVAVLLAHGFGQTRESWLKTQLRLSAIDLPNLAWDMRGHGQSGANPLDRPYAVDDFVTDQLSAARQLGARPVMVGASMGGLTGLLAQARHAPFAALVLVDVTPRWEAAGLQRIQGFMTAFPDGFDDFAHAADAIAAYLPQRKARKTPEQLSNLLRGDASGRLRWHWDPRLLAEFMAGSDALQDLVSAAAREIDVPVLLISGGRSDLVSGDTVAHFLSLVPHAQHVRLPEATHMLAGDDNDAFTESLLHFLRAQFPTAVPASSRTHAADCAVLPRFASGVTP